MKKLGLHLETAILLICAVSSCIGRNPRICLTKLELVTFDDCATANAGERETEIVNVGYSANSAVKCTANATEGADNGRLLMFKNDEMVCDSVATDYEAALCTYPIRAVNDTATYRCVFNSQSTELKIFAFRQVDVNDIDFGCTVVANDRNDYSKAERRNHTIRLLNSVTQLSEMTGMNVSIAHVTWRRLDPYSLTLFSLKQHQRENLIANRFFTIVGDWMRTIFLRLQIVGSTNKASGASYIKHLNYTLNILQCVETDSPILINAVARSPSEVVVKWKEPPSVYIAGSMFTRYYNFTLIEHGAAPSLARSGSRSLSNLLSRNGADPSRQTLCCGNLTVVIEYVPYRPFMVATLRNAEPCHKYEFSIAAAVGLTTNRRKTTPFSKPLVVSKIASTSCH